MTAGHIRVDIRADFGPLIKKLDNLKRELRDRIIADTLNKIASDTRAQAKEGIKDEWNMPVRDITSKLYVKRANWLAGRLEVTIGASSPRGRSLNVVRFLSAGTMKGTTFKARGSKAKRKDIAGLGNQLGFQFKRAGGLKQIKGAFIGNKGRTVFVRTGSSRLPIKPVQVIDVPSMFNTKRLNAKLVANIRQQFPKVFEEKFARVMAKYR